MNSNLPSDFAWAPLVAELLVSNLETSVTFWCGLIGFSVAYDRSENRFSYLYLGSAQIMLEERNEQQRQWITGKLERPFGRGINFQIEVPDCEAVRNRLIKSDWPLYGNTEEKWYRAGVVEVGVRQFLVQDPDGYLVRIATSMGQRPGSIGDIQ
jgi:catechol 2,3-dioxygenase-like lactoylglutathione lyase family enzyme